MRRATTFRAIPLAVALLAGIASVSTASAAEGGSSGGSRDRSLLHAGFYLGAWGSSFTQEGGGQKTKLTSEAAPVFQGALGLNFGPVFVEYAPVVGLAYLDLRDFGEGRQEADDVSTWSLVSFNAGLRIPAAGARVFAGFGKQHYDFRYGTDIDFSGPFFRTGVGIDVHTKALAHVEIKAEYQRLFLDRSEAGQMPDGYATRANVWMILFGVRGGK